MAICKDPALTFLNGLGYNVVRLPRVGVEPLDILGKDRTIERLGRVDQMWTSAQPLPSITGPRDATSVAGQKTSEMKLSIGLKILSATLGAMGAAVPEVSVAYARARKVVFTFTDVKTFSAEPLEVGQYLEAGDVATSNPFVRRYFDDEDTSAFIITEVLKSNAITVTATDDRGAEVGVDLPAIQQAVGARVTVTSKSATHATLTYTGTELLTFGFKCFGIAFVDGQWNVFSAAPSADLAFAVTPAAVGGPVTPAILAPGRLVIR
jgi:hypothetical protein